MGTRTTRTITVTATDSAALSQLEASIASQGALVSSLESKVANGGVTGQPYLLPPGQAAPADTSSAVRARSCHRHNSLASRNNNSNSSHSHLVHHLPLSVRLSPLHLGRPLRHSDLGRLFPQPCQPLLLPPFPR